MRTASWLASLGLAATTLLPLAAGVPIPIVQVLDLSGPNGDTGKDFLTGAQVYFDKLNSRGGLRGRPLKLIVADDAGKPANTVALSRKLVAEHKPVALFAYFGAENVRAVLADASLRREGLPMVAPLVGVELANADPVFYLRASLADEMARIARFAAGSGFKRIALVVGDDAQGSAAAQAIATGLRSNQLILSGTAVLNSEASNVEQAAATLLRTQPQAVLLAAPTIASAAFVQAYQRQQPGTAFYAVAGINPQTLREFLGGEAARWVAVSALVPSPYNPTTPLAREFVATLKQYRDEPPSHSSLEGFAAAKLLVSALEQAGDISPAGLRSALEKLRTDLGGLPLRLDGDNRRASRYGDMAVISADGKLVN